MGSIINLHIVEVAGRMGGDFIGSHLVELSTGFDFLKATVDIAIDHFNYENYVSNLKSAFSGIYFINPKPGVIRQIINNSYLDSRIIHVEFIKTIGDIVYEQVDSSEKRTCAIIYSSDLKVEKNELEKTIIIKT